MGSGLPRNIYTTAHSSQERLYLNALWHILSFFFIYGPPSSTQFGDDTL